MARAFVVGAILGLLVSLHARLNAIEQNLSAIECARPHG